MQKGYFSEMIGPLLLTSVYIIRQSEGNNHSSLLRRRCSFWDPTAEWKTDFLQAGAEVLEAPFILQQKQDEIGFLDSCLTWMEYFLITVRNKKLIWPTFLKFQFGYVKRDPEAIWTLRLRFTSVPVTKQMFMFM